MPDAAHVRAAEAYFRYCPEELKPRLARAILDRAAEYGVDVESPTVLGYAKQQEHDERIIEHCRRLVAGKDKIRVLFVCLGNICRSPAADVCSNRL